MEVTSRVITRSELSQWLRPLHPNMTIAILFAGDRTACCDEVVAIELEGQIAGVATISPEGETGNGVPEIVGMYVHPTLRCRGLGRELLIAAIRRCQVRGFNTVRVDVLSERVNRIITTLPPELRTLLDVHDLSSGMNLP